MAVQYHPPPPVPVQPPKKDNTMVIVAVIVVVVLLVVGVSFLYVMVIDGDGGYHSETPLGLNQMSRTHQTVTLLVTVAPDGALVDGTQISITSEGMPKSIMDATIYWPNATIAAYYYAQGGIIGWSYYNGASRNTLEFQAGMTIIITTDSVINGITYGDRLTLSSYYGYYGTTTFTIQY